MENLLECLKLTKSQRQNTEQLTCEPLGPRLWSHSECPMSWKPKKSTGKRETALLALTETFTFCFHDLFYTAFSFIIRVRRPESCCCDFVPWHSEPTHIQHHNTACAHKTPTAIASLLAKCLKETWQKESWYISKEITKTKGHLII